jgi:hypothetical protein
MVGSSSERASAHGWGGLRRSRTASDMSQSARIQIDEGGPGEGGKYGFLCALISGIELFTARLAEQDARAFQYRDSTLRYAAERDLYFRCVNSPQLLALYESAHRGASPDPRIVTGAVEREIAQLICGPARHAKPIELPATARSSPIDRVRHARARLTRALRGTTAVRTSRSRPDCDVLVYAVHEKFVRYLSPVLRELPAASAFLLTAGELDAGALWRERHAVIDHSARTLNDGALRPRSALHQFRWLLRSYDRFRSSLAEIRPRCVLLAEGNAPQDELINRAAASLSIPVVCVQQGWSPVVHNGFRNMSYTKMLVWGTGFAEILQPHNPAQRFISTGSHVLSLANDSDAASVSKTHAPGIAFFLQAAESPLLDVDHWHAMHRLIDWTAVRFPTHRVLVREHPGHPLSPAERTRLCTLPNVHLVPPRDHPIAEVLSGVQLSVSIYSTAIVESIATGVVPLVFNPTTLPSYMPDVAGLGAGIEVKTSASAQRVIEEALESPEFMRRFAPAMRVFRAKYFQSDEAAPTKRIVSEIMTAV